MKPTYTISVFPMYEDGSSGDVIAEYPVDARLGEIAERLIALGESYIGPRPDGIACDALDMTLTRNQP